MSTLTKEAEFFAYIAPKIRELVLSFRGTASISVQKTSDDYSTEVDIAVENLIVAEIEKRFPGDLILAEEGHSQTSIASGRIWIIDPICGTSNIARGITAFCTNIALADNRVLVASCVVDHSQDDYFWSIGNNTVYINDRVHIPKTKVDGMGIVIDIDMGSVKNVESNVLDTYTTFIRLLMQHTGYMPASTNSSLGFAYCAIGKYDGFVNIYNHPWDICASVFLLQQAGGSVTELTGKPWHIESVGAIGALDASVHSRLVKAYGGT